jgi:gamma-glutamylcyclotransferase (GGCT)/AIG2-like uncharacterized protein YtfP
VTESNVYVYGTLQEPSIVRLIVGRTLVGAAAVLEGHARFRLEHKVYPAIVAQPGERVSGLLYSGLTQSELRRLDEYEGPLYERRELSVSRSGAATRAFTYVLKEQNRHLLSPEPWSLEQFRREHLASYLARITPTARAP